MIVLPRILVTCLCTGQCMLQSPTFKKTSSDYKCFPTPFENMEIFSKFDVCISPARG